MNAQIRDELICSAVLGLIGVPLVLVWLGVVG
jgi:hypothetical protein